jgi:hypothetical protein
METIAMLDTKESVFFSHRDPEFVRLGNVKIDV